MTKEDELNPRMEHTTRRYRSLTLDEVERDAGEFYKVHGVVTQQSLKEFGFGSLARAISRIYPGGIRMLRANLAFELEVPRDANGNVLWYQLEAEKRELLIEAQATKFVAMDRQLDQPGLRASNRRDLLGAIENHYPGGLTQLRDNLGVGGRRSKKYWNPEKIEQEALEFLHQEGKLTRRLLYERGRADLANAIFRQIDGGLKALKEKLSIESSSFVGALTSYEQLLESGAGVPFSEFLKGEK